MLKQSSSFDVTEWDVDAEFAIFPQGARAKEAVFSPANPEENCLVPSKRYLFKRSKLSYPDQFWGEVVAYRIGCVFGVEVPPAFASWNSSNNTCGALIEWFYNDGEELCILAGDFLTQTQKEFDRELGTNHNLRDNEKLLRTLSSKKLIRENEWRQWWVNALAFDALIGNTDRHQDNWAILFRTENSSVSFARLSPLFDNGTSLGHERFTDRVRNWSEERLVRYINRGTHKVVWSLDEPELKGHFELLKRALDEWPETRPILAQNISRLNYEVLERSIEDLMYLSNPVPFSQERYEFICRILRIRLQYLQQTTQ
jgi:hypothetical protein